MLTIVDMAAVGGALSSEDAISHLAEMIDRLDTASSEYEADVEVLMAIGATIWSLQYDLDQLRPKKNPP